ncbi:MAG: PorT family protein [Chitinophagaceae bacterium]|nr:PorT family protein [Chitinophagaceae bacterium]
MKFKLISFCTALFIFSASFSQTLHVGLKAGTSINKISGQSFKDQFTFGYHVGAFAVVGLGGKISFQPEFLLNQVNQDTSSNFSSVYQFNHVSQIKLKYLTIPLILNYKLAKIADLQVGPQFGVLIDQNKNLLQNGSDAFKKGDFSLLAGLQLHFLKFRVYGRYVVGLSNVSNITNSDKWKNQSIQLGIGFTLL